MSDEKQAAVERENSWKIDTALHYIHLPGAPRDVLEVLIKLGRWDAHGMYSSFPSQANIARRKSLSPHSISKAVRVLEKRDFVRKQVQGNGFRYFVNVPLIMELARRGREKLAREKDPGMFGEQGASPLSRVIFPPLPESLRPHVEPVPSVSESGHDPEDEEQYNNLPPDDDEELM